MKSSFSFNHPGAIHPITPIVQCKTASAARNWIHYVPQKTATTTFAFSSVFILLHALLAGGQSIRPPAHWNAECREWCSHTDNQLRDKTLLRIFLPPPPAKSWVWVTPLSLSHPQTKPVGFSPCHKPLQIIWIFSFLSLRFQWGLLGVSRSLQKGESDNSLNFYLSGNNGCIFKFPLRQSGISPDIYLPIGWHRGPRSLPIGWRENWVIILLAAVKTERSSYWLQWKLRDHPIG